jgi:hypothetical protein
MPCPPPPCCSPPPCRPKKKKCHDPCGDDDDEEEGDDEDHDGGVHIPPDPQGGSGVGGATRACGYLHSPALKINLSDQDGRREFDVELLLRCVAEYQVTLTAFTTTPDAAHPEPRELEVLLDPNSRRFRPMTVNRRVSVRISLGQGSQPGKYRGQVLATERNGRFVVRRNVLVNVTSVVYSIPKTPPGTPVSKSAGP